MRHTAPRAHARTRALAAAIAATLLTPAIAGAQGIVSLESDIQYRHYTEDDLDVVSGRSSGELSFGNGFGAQADILLGRLQDGDRSTDGQFAGLTLHGIYELGGGAAAGAFVGRDYSLGPDATVLGIEGRFELQGSRIEPWVSRAFVEGGDMTTLGLSAFSQMASGLGLHAHVIHNMGEDEYSLTDLEFTTSYQFVSGAEVYGSAGYIIADDGSESEGEASLGLGVRVDLGPEGGTRFGSRSLFESIR